MARKSLKRIIGFAVMVMIGAAGGYLIGKLGSSAISKGAALAMLIFIVPAFFVVITAHELGHTLAGKLVKFDFRVFVVGPFMWEREKRWKFKWNKNVNVMGGMVLCIPTGDQHLRQRFSIYAAGGPFASLVSALVCYGVYKSIAPDTGEVTSLISAGFFLIAIFSAIIFVVTSLPLNSGGLISDGGRILSLMRGGDRAYFEIKMLKLISASMAGTRPSELDPNELLETLILGQRIDAPFSVYILGYLHQNALDLGKHDEAEHYLHRYIGDMDKIPAGIRNTVWLDAAFFYAFAKQDLARAVEYMNQFKPFTMMPQSQLFATEAAIAILKGERAIGLEKIRAAREQLSSMIDRGAARGLADSLNTLEARTSKSS